MLNVLKTRILFVVLVVVFLTASASTVSAQVNDRPCGPDSIPPALKVFLPQGVAGADFRNACREHDRCYTPGSGFTQAQCDCQFLHNMMRECDCSRNPRRCARRARLMYQLTRKYGHKAYGTW